MDSKALSTEIKVLFETIENQSTQYRLAFERLESRIIEFDKLTTKHKDILTQVQDKTSDAISNLNSTLDERLNFLHEQVDNAVKRTQKLSSLEMLQSEHKKLVNSLNDIQTGLIYYQNDLKRMLDQYEDYFAKFKERNSKQIEDVLSLASIKIDNLIKTETKKLESTLNYQIRFIDGKVIENSQDIKGLQRELTAIVNSNNETLKVYDEKFLEFDGGLMDKIRDMRTNEEELFIKLNMLESAFSAFREEIVSTIDEVKKNSNRTSGIKSPEINILRLSNDFTDFEEKLESLQKKFGIVLILVIFAIIISFLAIFI